MRRLPLHCYSKETGSKMLLLPLIVTPWALLACTTAESIPLVRRDAPSVVSFELQASTEKISTVLGPTLVEDSAYWVNASLGTPPQPLSLAIDLERSDVLVLEPNSENSDPCSEVESCLLFGYFNASKSSSYKTVTVSAQSTYPTEYYTDTLTIGGQKVDDISLTGFDIQYGAANTLGVSCDNDSFPYKLVDQGFIRSPSFSLWGDVSGNGQGGILFGGVNTAKYNGPLEAFSFNDTPCAVTIPTGQLVVQEASNRTADGAVSNYTLSQKPLILSLDMMTYLPNDTVKQMYSDLGIDYAWMTGENVSTGALECSRQNTENHTLSLTFGNVTISAPWSEFFYPFTTDGLCQFAIQPSQDGYYSPSQYAGQIGFTFVRHMYLAIDYDNLFVGVATLNVNPGADDILEIGNEPKLPNAVGDFPASITPYTPSPTTTTTTMVASTSTGEAPKRTIMSHKIPVYLLPGLAGIGLFVNI